MVFVRRKPSTSLSKIKHLHSAKRGNANYNEKVA